MGKPRVLIMHVSGVNGGREAALACEVVGVWLGLVLPEDEGHWAWEV